MHNWKCIWQRKLHSVCSSNQYRSVRMNHHRRWMYGVNIKVVVFETFCGACLHTSMHSTQTQTHARYTVICADAYSKWDNILLPLLSSSASLWRRAEKKNIVVAIKAKPVFTAISLSERVWVSVSMSVCFLCCFRFPLLRFAFFPLHFHPLHPDLHHLHFWNFVWQEHIHTHGSHRTHT